MSKLKLFLTICLATIICIVFGMFIGGFIYGIFYLGEVEHLTPAQVSFIFGVYITIELLINFGNWLKDRL